MAHATPSGTFRAGLSSRTHAEENTSFASSHRAMTPGGPLAKDSYFEKFLGSRTNTKPIMLESDRLISDRAAYISFLEAQLERVSSAVVTNDAINERMLAQASMLHDLQDKVVTLTQLIQMTQAYSERQGQEAGAAVAALHTAVQQMGARVDDENQRVSALQADVHVVATRQNEVDDNVARIVDGLGSVRQEFNRLDTRCDAIIEATKELEKVTAPREDMLWAKDAVSQLNNRTQEAHQHAMSAQKAAEKARDVAARAADNAVSAEASAINAMEHAKVLATASNAALEQARQATDEVVACKVAAQSAEAASHAALKIMTESVAASSMGATLNATTTIMHDTSSTAALNSSMLRKSMLSTIPAEEEVEGLSRAQPAGRVDNGAIASAVHSAVTRVMDAIGPQLRTISQHVANNEQEIQRVKASTAHLGDKLTRVGDELARGVSQLVTESEDRMSRLHVTTTDQLNSRIDSLQRQNEGALEDVKRGWKNVRESCADNTESLRKDVASAVEDLRKGVHRVASRTEEVADAWTTWEAAFSASHRETSEAALVASRSREAAAETERRRDRDAVQATFKELQQTFQALQQRVFEMDSRGNSAAAAVQVEEMRASTRNEIEHLRCAVDERLQDLAEQFGGLAAQFLHSDTEHKQLVRAADSLVTRWSQTNETITELQVQLSDIRQRLPTSSEGQASATHADVAPSMNPREIMRVIDALVQPRMQDIAAELHQRLNEQVTALGAELASSSPARLRSPMLDSSYNRINLTSEQTPHVQAVARRLGSPAMKEVVGIRSPTSHAPAIAAAKVEGEDFAAHAQLSNQRLADSHSDANISNKLSAPQRAKDPAMVEAHSPAASLQATSSVVTLPVLQDILAEERQARDSALYELRRSILDAENENRIRLQELVRSIQSAAANASLLHTDAQRPSGTMSHHAFEHGSQPTVGASTGSQQSSAPDTRSHLEPPMGQQVSVPNMRPSAEPDGAFKGSQQILAPDTWAQLEPSMYKQVTVPNTRSRAELPRTVQQAMAPDAESHGRTSTVCKQSVDQIMRPSVPDSDMSHQMFAPGVRSQQLTLMEQMSASDTPLVATSTTASATSKRNFPTDEPEFTEDKQAASSNAHVSSQLLSPTQQFLRGDVEARILHCALKGPTTPAGAVQGKGLPHVKSFPALPSDVEDSIANRPLLSIPIRPLDTPTSQDLVRAAGGKGKKPRPLPSRDRMTSTAMVRHSPLQSSAEAVPPSELPLHAGARRESLRSSESSERSVTPERVTRSASADAAQRHVSSPGRHLSYSSHGNVVYSIQTQAGKGMNICDDVHCAKADRKPPVPPASKLGSMPSWYARRASELSSGLVTPLTSPDPDSSRGSSVHRQRLTNSGATRKSGAREVESAGSRASTASRGRHDEAPKRRIDTSFVHVRPR